jgi:hypothetical protein
MSGTHRQLDLDLCSIEKVGRLIHAEPTKLSGHEGPLAARRLEESFGCRPIDGSERLGRGVSILSLEY